MFSGREGCVGDARVEGAFEFPPGSPEWGPAGDLER
jgi:hypothetical protein